MTELPYLIARELLNIQAVKFNFEEPFTWTSGWKSPVYCDSRASLSNHKLRSLVRDGYVEIIKEKFPNAEVIAGIATGAIAQGVLVADKLDLPFIYVRPERKEHGLKKIIEGHFDKGQKVVIIEDHVSTGGSSIKAFNELQKERADVLGMVAAFSYRFPVSENIFKEHGCEFHAISPFSMIKDVAFKEGFITKEQANRLEEWYKNPQDYR